MKSKQSQLVHLGDVLQKLKSGLYLVDTELDEKNNVLKQRQICNITIV